MNTQCKAAVVGFSRPDCPKCKGTGRKHWQSPVQGTIVPCKCVTFFDMEAVVTAAARAAEQAGLPEEKASGPIQ